MAPLSLQTGWHRRSQDEYLFVWGSACDVVDNKHRAIFVLTSGNDACKVLSLEVGRFLELLAQHRYKHTTEQPTRLPPDFPTNLFVNRLA
jgi:hypothetical protein